MSDIIQLLPDHVANQIAAGEVVQRPSSVVKELLENAIDAHSSRIQLIIKDAGKTLIQVIDNGDGMSTTDARMSFERHATSKIKLAEDLFQLNTKGFRGEALASIAAIAHVELKTKPHDDELGTAITIEGSTVHSQEVTVTPGGTSIAVKNLFFNIPARRNFLKSDAVELRHIMDEFHRVALAHPEVAFTMHHNGSELFALPKSNQRQRVVHVFGTKTNAKLVPVSETTEVLTIQGFVGKPEFARKTRSEQFFFVNNRYVKSPYLNHAVVSAFEGLLKEGYHPSYFLNLTVDPESIDINIHPTKTEIKFEDEHTLYALLRSAVKHSLGQFNIAPVLDFEKDASLDTPYAYKDRVVNTPRIEVDKSFNPFADEQKNTHQTRAGHTHSAAKNLGAPWEALYTQMAGDAEKNSDPSVIQSFESRGFKPELFEGQSHSTEGITYQIQGKYLIKPLVSGILIVDQHRAHQRVLYEKFLKQFTIKSSVSQQLLFPVTLHFSKPEIVIIKDLQMDLEQAGFNFEAIEADAIVFTGIPAVIPEVELKPVLDQLISDVENEVPDQNFSMVDLMAKSLAKSLAIKRGQELNRTEQMHLVDSLFACKECSLSPKGQLAYYVMEPSDIEKKFK